MERKNKKQEPPFTSADYYNRAAQHQTAIRKLWNDFIVSCVFAAAALIVLVFFTIAWFVNNTRVAATSATISAKGERYAFTVAQVEDQEDSIGAYDSAAASKANGSLDISDAMTVNAQNNLLNLKGNNGQLGPGSSGQLQFTVIPYANDLRDITITLSRNLVLRAVEQGSSAVISSAGPNDSNNNALYKLAQGHILFFLGRDKTQGYSIWLPTDEPDTEPATYSYSYIRSNGTTTSNFISNIKISADSITIPSAAFCGEGEDRKKTTMSCTFTLYWVWPELLNNMIFTGSGNLFNPGTTQDGTQSEFQKAYDFLLKDINHTDSTDKTKFDRRDKYFLPDATHTEVDIDQANISGQELMYYSKQYNLADEKLGKEIEYMQIRLVSEEKAAGTSQGSEAQGAA